MPKVRSSVSLVTQRRQHNKKHEITEVVYYLQVQEGESLPMRVDEQVLGALGTSSR
jgi:hypothetical protein